MAVRDGLAWAAVAVGACGALLAGCTAATPPGAGPPASAAVSAVAATSGGGGHPAHQATGALVDPAGTPADKALQLEALLGQHSVLVADMMRGRLRGDDDFGQAADSAVRRNTDDLTAVVGSLFGEGAASTFRPRWGDHVTTFFNYARAQATGDAAGRDRARAELGAFESDLADFFSGASQGRLPRDAARAAVEQHVAHLLDQSDAYAARDYARSDALYRESYAHTFEIGHSLAATLLPPEQAAALDEPSWRLRSALDRLLGEHVALAVGALRAGGTSSPDTAAAVEALNGNTRDLAGAMGALFGPDAGAQFLSLWADHIDQLISYTTGAAGGDTARKDAAREQLRGFEGRMASFLDGATGGKVSSGELAKAYLSHDEMLTQQVDAFAGRDFPRAHELAYQTYQEMFGLSRQLADAFGDTVAARLPRGGAETGGGAAPPGPGAAPLATGGTAVAPGSGQDAAGPAPADLRSVRRFDAVAEPVRLRIPAIGVDTPLVTLGRAADGTVEVPADFGVGGWFAGGPRPGQPGPAVLLGHVDSRRGGPAVFYRLGDLPVGAHVQVDRADGTTIAFRVTATVRVPKTAFPTAAVYGPTLEPSLRLVTCGGSFDRTARSYRDNVIVSAEPVR